MNRPFPFQIFISICLIFLSGCGADDSGTFPFDKEETELVIQDNLSLWNSSTIENYTFSYYVEPTDCLAFTTVEAQRIISVEDSVVTNVRYFNSDSPLGNEVGITINEIFTFMLEQVGTNPRVFSDSAESTNSLPIFNVDLGYPETFYLDPSDAECDGLTYFISGFEIN